MNLCSPHTVTLSLWLLTVLGTQLPQTQVPPTPQQPFCVGVTRGRSRCLGRSRGLWDFGSLWE